MVKEFFHHNPSETPQKRSFSIVQNMWETNNAVTFDQFRKMRDLVLKYIANNYYNSIIWKSSIGHLLPGVNLYEVLREIDFNRDIDKVKQFYKEVQQFAYKLATGNRLFLPFLSGSVMGVGGVFLHANTPIATESTRIAAPGNGYGFVGTEAGFTYLFSKLPSRLPEYYLVTGKAIETTDLVHLNLAMYYIPTERSEELEKSLSKIDSTELQPILEKIFDFVDNPGECHISKYFSSIERCFSKPTIAEIMKELENEVEHVEWAQNTLKRMKANCPTSMAISLKAARMARFMNLEQCLKMEYGIICRRLESEEFRRVLRTLISEHKLPEWDEVGDIDEYFKPLNADEILVLEPQDKGVRVNIANEIERLRYRSEELAHLYSLEKDEDINQFLSLKQLRRKFNEFLVKQDGAGYYGNLLEREDFITHMAFDMKQTAIEETAHEKQD